MKPRYNLRLSSSKNIHSSRVTKKSFVRRLSTAVNRQTRRHSLRLNPIIKQVQTRSINKSRKIENEPIEETSSTEDVDNYEELLARHHRRMLEEQKDRKLYERYVRDQRTLRRLQCRRTHTAHLSETTRNRLLRELERERRYTVHDQICAHLANHPLLFRHKHPNQPMDWTSLEDELPRHHNRETIRQLDVMINNLKKVTHPSKSNTSKPRLSVHERQKQRLAAGATDCPLLFSQIHSSSSSEIHSHSLNVSHSSNSVSPMVRFADEDNFHSANKNNPQHLTCIQNVLSQNNHHSTRLMTNEISTPMSTSRRSKSIQSNFPESSTSKKRALEKENCSLVTSTTATNIVLRANSPMISIKSSASANTCRNTRKIQTFATRRRERTAL